MITQREFGEIRIRGYRWVYEITERDEFWNVKVYIGGKLAHDTGNYVTRLAALLQAHILITANPYYK